MSNIFPESSQARKKPPAPPLGDHDDHGPIVSDFVNWCNESYLCLNVSKTKDLSINFWKESVQPQPTVIHDETVESVDRFKYHGMITDFKLKFSRNYDIIFQKRSAATALS